MKSTLTSLIRTSSFVVLFNSCLVTGAKKPNILFIFADDQSYETIAALGNEEIRTSNLDRLVNMGYGDMGWSCLHGIPQYAQYGTIRPEGACQETWVNSDTGYASSDLTPILGLKPYSLIKFLLNPSTEIS